MAKETKTKRERRDPKARAEAALGVAERKVATVQKRLDKATADVAALTTEHAAAVRERDYLAQNPALIAPPEEPQVPAQPVA
jgi:ferric-dicitrate binding protein FerR (iron transport regulator)